MKRLPTVLHGEGSNKLSSKRVITFALALTFIVVVLGNVFFGVYIDKEIYDGLVEILIWALAFIGSEHVASAMGGRRRRYTNSNPENELPQRPGGEEREQF